MYWILLIICLVILCLMIIICCCIRYFCKQKKIVMLEPVEAAAPEVAEYIPKPPRIKQVYVKKDRVIKEKVSRQVF